MKRAIVTGAGGFIGKAVAKRLLDEEIEVWGIDISPKLLEELATNKNFHPVIADFTKYNELSDMLPHGADVFYHFAWQGVCGDAFKNYSMQLDNAKYSCDALMAAVKSDCRRFVMAGSVNEYEMDSYIGRDYFEPRYTYIYSSTKQISEAIGKTLAYYNSIDFCCGRIAMAYGENNSSKMLPNVVINSLINNKPVKLIEGKNLYDMVYISDIADAFLAIGKSGVNMKSYYIGHRNLKSFRAIIEEIASILNPDCPLLFGEYPDVQSGINYNEIDKNALYNDTGFECKADFRESILKTAQWVKTLNWN